MLACAWVKPSARGAIDITMTTWLSAINLAVVLVTVAISVVAAYGSGRMGARRANEQAAAAWRDLAEARAQELAEVRDDIKRLRAEVERVKRDDRQLREVNTHLMAENMSLRQRVNALESEVKALTRQVNIENRANLEREAARKVYTEQMPV